MTQMNVGDIIPEEQRKKIVKEPKFVVIGMGSAGTGVSIYLEKFIPGCVVAFADFNRKLFDSIIDERGIKHGVRKDFKETVRFYTDVDKMLSKEEYDGVIIATYCNTHFEMVEKCVKKGKYILLEKPIEVEWEKIKKVYELLKDYPYVVCVDFPLRTAPVIQAAKKYIQEREIGKLISVQYINNIHYGDGYFRGWMRTKEKIGSLLLQKAVHDFDIINYLTDQKPIKIAAFGSKLVYGGDKPEGLTCDICEENLKCPESIYWKKFFMGNPSLPHPTRRKCVYSKEIDVDDNQVVITQYESGLTASYSQTFCAPTTSASRGGCFIGTKGILELKLYGDSKERFGNQLGTSQIDITYKHRPPLDKKQEIFDWIGEAHFNGSQYLVKNFIDSVKGKSQPIATINDGFLSAKMCIAAQKSIEENNTVILKEL